MNPTQEQVTINNLVKNGDNLLIEAFAGTGKSSTLRYVASQNPDKNFLVLCFNAANVIESVAHPDKPDNIYYGTIHSIAYKEIVDRSMQPKLKQGYFNYKDINQERLAKILPECSDKKEQKRQIILACKEIQNCLTYYCRSDSNNLILFAENYFESIFSDDTYLLQSDDLTVEQKGIFLTEDQQKDLALFTKSHWLDLIDVDKDTSITHDTYLKLFHLRDYKIDRFFDKKLKEYIDIDVVALDEAQDSNPVTLSIFNKIGKQKIVVGDRYQCVLEGTLVDGIPIENIQVGELISSAVNGKITKNKITSIICKDTICDLITITTSLGKKLTTTDNHTHFTLYPDKANDYWYVYLMYKENIGYRIGITQDIRQRCKAEIADAIWIINYYKKFKEARIYETSTSYNYKIPELTFISTKGRYCNDLTQDEILTIYSKIDSTSGAMRLLSEIGLSVVEPHFLPIKYNCGKMNVTITMCGDARNISNPMHRYSVMLSAQEAELVGKYYPEYNVRTTGKQNTTYRIEGSSTDLSIGYKLYQDLVKIFPEARLKELVKITELESFNFTSARNLVPGMFVLVEDNGKLKIDRIVEVNRTIKKSKVYDVNVDKTHNFIANGIVTHNCLYAWRGATNAMTYFPDYTKAYLTESFRFNSNIADVAMNVLSFAGNTLKLKGSGHVVESKSKAILCRTNAEIIALLNSYADTSTKVFLMTDLKPVFSQLYHIEAVFFNKVPKFPNKLLTDITNKEQLIEAMHVNDDINALCKLANNIRQQHGSLYGGIQKLQSCITDKQEKADIVISTIHKSKGLEWDSVEIAHKLIVPSDYEEGVTEEEVEDWLSNYENQCLLYVAVTRARHSVSIPEYLQDYLY